MIHISMGKGASQGYDRAVQAARGFDNVYVVDSGHLSSGMGLIVLRAAQMAGQNHTAEEIIAEIERMRDVVSTSFIVPSPESMYHGGKKNIDTRVLFFTYAGCSVELRRELLAEVEKYQSFDRVIEQKASAASTSNCGLGTFGLMYLKK